MSLYHYGDGKTPDHSAYWLEETFTDPLNVLAYCEVCKREVRAEDCYYTTPWG